MNNFECIHVGHLERNVERASGSLGNEAKDGKTDIRSWGRGWGWGVTAREES